MSKKTKGHNAFYFFMLEWRERQRMRNCSLKEIAADPRCNDEWKSLSSTHRGRYEALAKESKIQARGSAGKKTAIGEDLHEVEEQARQELEFEQNMMKYITSVVSVGLRHENLENLNFVFIHVNWFYIKEVGINKYDYGPAEFALAEFSLKNGIKNLYHEILNIPIPLGWKADALMASAQTHQIPIGYSHGESDFQLMYSKLVTFLESSMTGNKFPPLFTTKTLKPAVDSLLLRMCNAADQPVDDFKIYSLEALFTELRNAAVKYTNGEYVIPLVVAEIEFEKDVFAYVCGDECRFHKFLDNTSQYCSRSTVTRWGYTICDYCCNHMNIEMIEGVHYPASQGNDKEADVDDTDIVAPMGWLSTGSNHRVKVSERTYAEEQRRREKSKPLVIIDHGKIGGSANSEESIVHAPQRPLRLPKVSLSNDKIDSSYEKNFPSIGRGIRSRATNKELKSLGRGRNF